MEKSPAEIALIRANIVLAMSNQVTEEAKRRALSLTRVLDTGVETLVCDDTHLRYNPDHVIRVARRVEGVKFLAYEIAALL